MAKKRLSRSFEEVVLSEIYRYKNDAEKGLKLLFSKQHLHLADELMFATRAEVRALLEQRLEELDKQSSMALLASLEALFQIDFDSRVSKRKKDSLSAYFRTLKLITTRVSFDRDIITGWEHVHPETRRCFQPIRKALKYRHWLAHGRYWLLKSSPFDFDELYTLAEALQNMLEEQA